MFQGKLSIVGKFGLKKGFTIYLARPLFVVLSISILALALIFAFVALPVRAVVGQSGVKIAPVSSLMEAGDCDFYDQFEPNNGPNEAAVIAPNGPSYDLDFDTEADEDWFLFLAYPGSTYTITASNLSQGADTILFLFRSPNFDEPDAIDTNDDFGGTLGSQIVFKASKTGLYFFKLRDFNSLVNCHTYTLTFAAEHFQFWPRIDIHPTPTFTPTLTPTVTQTPTPSPTPTFTPTSTPTPTPSPTYTPTPIPGPTPKWVLGSGLSFPNDVAVNYQTHVVYVTSRDTNQVLAINPVSGHVIATIPVCQKPFGIDVNSLSNKVYVACFVDGTVDVIDGFTNTVIKNITVGPQPTYVGVNESTNRAYVVTHGDGNLVEIDGGNLIRTRSVKSDRGAFGLAVNEGLNRVYVTNRDLQNVTTIDTNTMTKIDWQTVRPDTRNPEPFGIVFNPGNNRLYFTYKKDERLTRVAIYQASANGLSYIGKLTIPDGGSDAPGVLGVNPTTGHVFIPNSASNSVTVIDSANNSIRYNIPLGGTPFGVDVDPITNKVYVVTKNSHQLWMIPD